MGECVAGMWGRSEGRRKKYVVQTVAGEIRIWFPRDFSVGSERKNMKGT